MPETQYASEKEKSKVGKVRCTGEITPLFLTRGLFMNSVATFYLVYWSAERTPSTAASAFCLLTHEGQSPCASPQLWPQPTLCVPFCVPFNDFSCQLPRFRPNFAGGGHNLNKAVLTSDTSFKLGGSHATCTSDQLATNLEFLTNLSDSVIRINISQNSKKCYTYDYSFAIASG